MPSFPGGLHSGTVVPLDRPNVDTDAIFPKQYGRSTARSGFGPVLFDLWRYLDPGDLTSDHSRRRPNPDFVLNRPELAGASVLLARANFGCGSSREHAVWALRDHGIRVVLAPSFGDIFRQNCTLNGLAALQLTAAEVQQMFDLCAAGVLRVQVDLTHRMLHAGAFTARFALSAREARLLTEDIDWIGATLRERPRIVAFEAQRLAHQPWLDKRMDA